MASEEKKVREKTILALRQVIVKQNTIEKTTFIAFVNIEKEFDNVKWIKMFNILEKGGEHINIEE